MVFITPFFGVAALLSGYASALPRPDSSINEPGVSAPDGTPITDTSSQATATAGSNYGSSGSYDSSGSYGSGGSYDSSGNYGSYGSGSSYGSSNQWNSVSQDSWTSTTAAVQSTSTSTAWNSYSTPSYGSGNSNWGGSGYNDCVNQCVASYGAPMAAYTPTATGSSEGSTGTGATHTVIVAPSQGVLRFVPFAVNASVGDTVMFMWGANNHTVTKSSSLTPCNRSSDPLFTSGTQNKGFTFTQVVNDTNPTFFYCATVGHCQKGMFGIINPPNAFAAPSSVSAMMQPLAANNSDVAAYSAYSNNMTANNANASKWGGSIDMSSLPDWSHEFVAENVLYTRNFLAANPDVLKDDGSVDLSGSGSTPLMFPQDLNNALSSTTQSTPSSGASPSSATGASSSAPPSSATGASSSASPSSATGASSSAAPSSSGTSENLNKSNAAGSLVASKLLVGGIAMLASFLLL